MPLFIIFVLGAVIIGTGALLAPAWPTAQPRIGLAAALALGLVVGGAIFCAMFIGWNTLVVDYLLFALVTTIFLGGTLTFGQKRAEARGISLADFQEGWPGPRDLLFFALVALVFIVPVLMLPVPMDTDAQGFGYLALTARLGGGFDTLAPFHPEITYLYAPGFSALTAYLSQQLQFGMHQIQFSVAAVLGFILVWLAYDFGTELQDKRLGRAMAVAMIGGVGLYTAYMDSHYTTMLALVFALAFLTYTLRYLRDGLRADAIAAGLMLGSVVLAHPDTTIILMLGYVPWLLTMWLGKPRPTLKRWLVLALGIPALAVLAISPWLYSIRGLLGSDIVSPFMRDPNYWRVMILYHGILIVPIALVGAVVGLRGRRQEVLLALGWLVLVLDFSTTGVIEQLFPWLVAPILRYDYPFSIAWHGPIIPYTVLGGIGLLWLWDKLGARVDAFAHRYAYVGIGAAALIALGVLFFNGALLDFSRGRIGFYGAFSSHDDVAAMSWLKANAAPDARILNYPGPHEADWVPVIAERDTVYFRPQPFFTGTEAVEAEQAQLLAFWENPADPANEALLASADIAYVIVPQIVTDPASQERQFRWARPFTSEVTMQSTVDEAAYLELVFDANGAQVYELKRSAAS
jgi:hypothetical protein